MRIAPSLAVLICVSACLLLCAPTLTAQTPEDTGPDTVAIDGLSYWFGPVEFPHADHVDLAESCADCHHHGDGPDDIIACADCHGEEFDPAEPETPALKMAYHQRCIGCHRVEDAGPVACVDCHERKALPAGPELGEGRVPE